jgi:hypothetical protein
MKCAARKSAAAMIRFILVMLIPYCSASSQPNKLVPDVAQSEKQELNVYREYVPKLVDDLKSCKSGNITDGAIGTAYSKYLKAYYEQAIDFRRIRIELYSWQLFAGNGILLLVLIMSLGGFFITVFQIYQLYKLNIIEQQSSFNVSLRQIQVTTSVTGVVVLLISFLFLFVFLREVYRIHPPVAAKSLTISSNSQP